MQNTRQKFGQQGESLAVWYLKKNGYKILEQNYRTKLGEIDIIAKEKKTLVFVEVKSRRSIRFGNPKWAVTLKKQRQISMVALSYLKATKQSDTKARFDVVAITANQDQPQIEIVKNAFELAYDWHRVILEFSTTAGQKKTANLIEKETLVYEVYKKRVSKYGNKKIDRIP